MKELFDIEHIKSLADALQNSSSSEGCGSDLTVVDAGALESLVNAIDALTKIQNNALMFVANLAATPRWEHEFFEGDDPIECRPPSDGYSESHGSLMAFIKDARAILASNSVEKAR